MKTCSPYISIILDGEEFEAERVPTVVICNDEEELFIVESYFGEESLALIGKRDTVKVDILHFLLKITQVIEK